MFKFVLLFAILGLTCSAPTSENRQPTAEPKLISLISESKTPASTAKLTNIIAPVPPPLVPHYAYVAPVLSPVAPYAYAFPALAPIRLASIPSTYSIEQHGYTITY